MNERDFRAFVDETIEEVICIAEKRSGATLTRNIAFQWLGEKTEPRRGGALIDEIVRRVYFGPLLIKPCVDIGIGDLLDDGTPLLVAYVAGYPPMNFRKNWTGRDGPFVPIIGGAFLRKIAGKPDTKTLGTDFHYG